MKTTTYIIIGLITATIMLILVSPVFDMTPDKSVINLSKVETIHAREITDIVSVDSALEDLVYQDNYVIHLEANDSLKEVIVSYPYQLIEARVHDRTLHLSLHPALQREDIRLRDIELVSDEANSDSIAGERLKAVVRVQMPSAILLSFLAKVNHASLYGVSLFVNGVRGDTLSFRKNLNLTLSKCVFNAVEVTLSDKNLELSHTRIGKLTFHATSNDSMGSVSSMNTDEDSWVDSLLVRGWMAYGLNLDYNRFGHITVEPSEGHKTSVSVYNIKGKVVLK